MNHVSVRRSAGTAGLAAVTATAIALSPLTIPAVNHSALQHHSMPLVTTQPVQLADTWSQLIGDTANSLRNFSTLTIGAGLPAVSNPIAPIAEQVAINVLTYAGQVVTGQGGQIPGEIADHLTKVAAAVQQFVAAVPLWVQQFINNVPAAWNQALQNFAANPLAGLIEAPAVFLDQEINGIGGVFTLLNVAVGTRNSIALALDPPLPSWLSWLKPVKAPATVSAVTPPKTVSVTSVPKLKATEGVSPQKGGSATTFTVAAAGKPAPTHHTPDGVPKKPDGQPPAPHTLKLGHQR